MRVGENLEDHALIFPKGQIVHFLSGKDLVSSYPDTNTSITIGVKEATVQAVRGTVDSSATNVAIWTDVRLVLKFTKQSPYKKFKVKDDEIHESNGSNGSNMLKGEVTIIAEVMHVICKED